VPESVHGADIDDDVGDADGVVGKHKILRRGCLEMAMATIWKVICGDARISASVHEATPPVT